MPSRLRSILPCAAGLALLLAGCGEDDVAAPAAPPAPVADVVTVTNVVDGDTVDVSDGRRVRLLGIDSCEIGTAAGRQATDAATAQLLSRTVTLTAEPGVDLDPSGRSLRYVLMPDGRDFGKAMVPFPHTGVYDGGGAGMPYLTELRALDVDGRVCDPPAPATSSSAPPPVVQDDDDRPYVPAPPDDDSRSNRSGSGSGSSSGSGSGSGSASDGSDGSGGSSGTKPRTGNSGHPCQPGERDGDDDGYCGEGR